MAKYKVTYFYQGLNDEGRIIEGTRTTFVDETKVAEYEEAWQGKTFAGCEYIRTQSIKRIK